MGRYMSKSYPIESSLTLTSYSTVIPLFPPRYARARTPNVEIPTSGRSTHRAGDDPVTMITRRRLRLPFGAGTFLPERQLPWSWRAIRATSPASASEAGGMRSVGKSLAAAACRSVGTAGAAAAEASRQLKTTPRALR